LISTFSTRPAPTGSIKPTSISERNRKTIPSGT
jgi:hypothetical protein